MNNGVNGSKGITWKTFIGLTLSIVVASSTAGYVVGSSHTTILEKDVTMLKNQHSVCGPRLAALEIEVEHSKETCERIEMKLDKVLERLGGP